MKKLLIFYMIFLILLGSLPLKGASEGNEEKTTLEYQVIPDEAIRLRILANSDEEEDQELKRMIRDEVNKEITKWVEEIADIDEARQLIQDNIDEIDAIVKNVLVEQGAGYTHEVEYGKNVKFPDKVYGPFIYPAGEYEAILISLGKAKGANWWCVLFPPLCFLDFSNGSSVAEAEEEDVEEQDEVAVAQDVEEEDEEEVEVKFFFMKWFS